MCMYECGWVWLIHLNQHILQYIYIPFFMLDLVKNADLMWKQSVWSSTITAKLASQYLRV